MILSSGIGRGPLTGRSLICLREEGGGLRVLPACVIPQIPLAENIKYAKAPFLNSVLVFSE